MTQYPHIKSFVIRKGKVTNTQLYALKHYREKYILETSNQITNWCQQQKKLVLEIGYGMGENLIHLATHNPQYNFLGIEVHQAGIGKTLYKIEQLKLQNIRLIAKDAIEVLEQDINDNSIHQVFILFPDPWQKKRHHKRRLINQDFISKVTAKLKQGATINIATDWYDYAKQIKMLLCNTENIQIASSEHGLARTTTAFELKGLKKGHKIYNFLYTKK